MKIRKNDIVRVISGKDRGKTGKVLRVVPKSGRIIVEGVNIYIKHVRPKKANTKGQIVKVTRSFDASNAMVVCQVCKRPTRTGYRTDGGKIRFCKKCKAPMR